MATNYCVEQGCVAPPTLPVPADPTAFGGRGEWNTTPCSNLICSSCGAKVRWLDGYMFDGRRRDLPVAFAAADPTTARGVETGPRTLPCRLYLCRCQFLNCSIEKSLSLRAELFLGDELPATWNCGGHPALRLPAVLDGVALAESPGWPALLEEIVRREPTANEPHRWPRWFTMAFIRLANTPHQAAIDAAFAAFLDASDPRLIGAAIGFFWGGIDLPSCGRLRDLALGGQARLLGVRDPRGDADLYGMVLEAVGYHVVQSGWVWDEPLRDAFRAHAERPGGLMSACSALADSDKAWLVQNRERLLQSSPEARARVTSYLR